MTFLINYWAVLLVAFILTLLVILAYLIDKKIKEMDLKDNVNSTLDVQENVSISNADLEDLDYDELDIENIDDEFNKIIPRKKVINDSIKDSVESLQVEPIRKSFYLEDKTIELPEIKIK